MAKRVCPASLLFVWLLLFFLFKAAIHNTGYYTMNDIHSNLSDDKLYFLTYFLKINVTKSLSSHFSLISKIQRIFLLPSKYASMLTKTYKNFDSIDGHATLNNWLSFSEHRWCSSNHFNSSKMFVLFFPSKNIIDYTEAKKRQSIGLVPHMVEDIRKYSNCADEHV